MLCQAEADGRNLDRMKRYLPLILVSAAIACSSGGGSTPSSTAPSTTAPRPPTVDTFTGTVPVRGNDSHSFVVALSNGQLTATLTAAGPPPTIAMGFGIGTPANGVCTVPANSTYIGPAGPTPQLSGTGITGGTYCVMVFDAGNQSADVTYTAVVTHY
jgi:hypothetical protein